MRVRAHTRQVSSSYLLLLSLSAPSSMEGDFAAVWLREGMLSDSSTASRRPVQPGGISPSKEPPTGTLQHDVSPVWLSHIAQHNEWGSNLKMERSLSPESSKCSVWKDTVWKEKSEKTTVEGLNQVWISPPVNTYCAYLEFSRGKSFMGTDVFFCLLRQKKSQTALCPCTCRVFRNAASTRHPQAPALFL